MKKLLFAIFATLCTITSLSAEERVIDQQSLPKSAQKFISTHYAADKVSIATMERGLFDTDYKVILTNGVKIEFDQKGSWTDIEGKRNREIPMAIVPSKIAKHVSKNFPANKIIQIDRDKRHIDIELDNGLELKFNTKGELIEIDN
ncbi:MAG: PepSY-like domain-containing protein [Rikenellaceae bacterium]